MVQISSVLICPLDLLRCPHLSSANRSLPRAAVSLSAVSMTTAAFHRSLTLVVWPQRRPWSTLAAPSSAGGGALSNMATPLSNMATLVPSQEKGAAVAGRPPVAVATTLRRIREGGLFQNGAPGTHLVPQVGSCSPPHTHVSCPDVHVLTPPPLLGSSLEHILKALIKSCRP